MDREMSAQLCLKDHQRPPANQQTMDVVRPVRARRAADKHGELAGRCEGTRAAMQACGPMKGHAARRVSDRPTRSGQFTGPLLDERWESLLECTSDLVVVVDGAGLIEYINHVSTKLSERQGDVVGRSINDFLTPEYRGRVREAIESVLRTGETVRQVVCFSANGGGALCSEACVGPITQDGRTVAVGMFFTDITERQRLQTRLRERERLLRSIVRAVPRMMDIVEGLIRQGKDVDAPARRAQELELCREQMIQIGRLAAIGKASSSLTQRLPQFLTAIDMSVENAIAKLHATSRREGAERELDAALRAIFAMRAGVEQLRGFAETGSRNSLVHAVDLKASLARVIQLLESRARGANTVICIGNRDEWSPVRMAEGDADQLFFALIENLLRLADGKRRHRITVGHAARDHHMELCLSGDDGLVEKEDSGVALDRPLRAGPTAQAVDLGLYVAWDIVIRAGGTIRRESAAGSGCTFFVCLPILDRVSSQGGQSGGKRKTACVRRR